MKKLSILLIGNLLLLAIAIIIVFILSFPYNLIFNISIILPIFYIFNFYAIHYYLEQYPLNGYEEYKINVYNCFNDLDDTKGILVTKEKGIYTVKIGNQILIFNLKKCAFPMTVITAYFIRQFQMVRINREKLPAVKLIKKLNVREYFPNLKNLYITYRKKHYIIRKYVTQGTSFARHFNAFWYIQPSSRGHPQNYKEYIKLEEKDYVLVKNKRYTSPSYAIKQKKIAEKNRKRNVKKRKKEKKNKKLS